MSSSPDQLFCLRWNNYTANIMNHFDQLLLSETFTDVTLSLEHGVNLKCHQMVLAASSSYFESLFTVLPTAHPIVILSDITQREMKEILEYMYTGQVKVAQENFARLIKIAGELKIKGLMADDISSSISEFTKRCDEATSTSPNNPNNSGQNFDCRPVPEQFSPPHSTSSPYYSYRKSPTKRRHVTNTPQRMWQHPPIVQNLSPDMAAPLTTKHSRLFPSPYESTVETPITHNRKNKISINPSAMRSHDTPILRNVLGQGHADSSLTYNQPDEHEYRSHSNGSANNDNDGRRSSTDTPNFPPVRSPYTTDTSMVEDDDKKPSPPSFSDDAKSAGIANYVPSQKPEWKRYKQYSREEISKAIEAVRNGMSALQAARKFHVPSRTLYDKVKKLGISTSRPFRRSSNGSGACFPYGLGGNVNGSIYGTVTENENDNGNVLTDNPASLLETTFGASRENSRDHEGMMENAPNSPSPQQLPHYLSHRSMLAEEMPQRETIDDIEDQVEDLSVSRRSDVGVIVSPGVPIKEEK